MVVILIFSNSQIGHADGFKILSRKAACAFALKMLTNQSVDPLKPGFLASRELAHGLRDVTAGEQEQLKDIANTNLALLTGFQPPRMLNFLIEKGVGNPSFDAFEGLGQVAVPEWIFQADKEKRKAATVLLSHELGHQIFIENMGLKGNGRFEKAWQKAWKIRNDAGLLFYQEIAPERPPDQYTISRSVNDKLTETEQRYWIRIQPFLSLSSPSMPYQELFSDLLAVLSVNDPGAAADLLPYLSTTKWEKENMALLKSFRDFKNNLTPKLILESLNPDEPDPHDVLAAVRGFIGKNYLPKIKNVYQKRILLEGVFQAITDELNSRFAAGSNGQLKKLPLDKMNIRLIKRIDAIMKDQF